MSRNAGGTMTTATMAVAGQVAQSATVNAIISDIATEITDSLSRSGKGGMLADLAMGTHKITGLSNGTVATDAAALGQLQTNTNNHATSVGGTGDAITATFNPTITSYATNLALRVTATAANTVTNPTINVDGLGTRTIKKLNGAALAAGDIAGSGHVLALVYNGTDMMLLNPAATVSSGQVIPLVVGKKKLWIPAAAMTPRTTNGPARATPETATNDMMWPTLDYDPTTEEGAWFSIAMPSSWNEGTVTFRPVWGHAATTVNFGVVWSLSGVCISDDDALDVAAGTAQTSTDTGGTTEDLYRGPESAAITLAGTPAANDVAWYLIKRVAANGSDTLAIDARLIGVELYITTDDVNDTA